MRFRGGPPWTDDEQEANAKALLVAFLFLLFSITAAAVLIATREVVW